MDLYAALRPLSPEPLTIQADLVIWATATGGAIGLPRAALETGALADWAARREALPLSVRLGALLDAGRETEAWRLTDTLHGHPAHDPAALVVLTRWAEDRRRAWELPASDGTLVLVSPGITTSFFERRRNVCSSALEDVRSLTTSLGWPRWGGPVVLAFSDEPVAGLARGAARLPRLALPVLRLSPDIPATDLRSAVAAAIMHLVLDCAEHPQRRWPVWLRTGLAAQAQATARGEGPSPRDMLAARQELGPDGLHRLLAATDSVDPAAALALCAPLAQSVRRQRLGALLDLLRNGVESETAIGIAYGLDLDTLLSRR